MIDQTTRRRGGLRRVVAEMRAQEKQITWIKCEETVAKSYASADNVGEFIGLELLNCRNVYSEGTEGYYARGTGI